MKPTTSEFIIVKKSKIHGNGVFAKTDIPKGSKIIEYVGEKLTKREADKRVDEAEESHKRDPTNGQTYIFELDDQYDIDGNVPYNTAKYINHSCDPNCETDIADGKIWIIAIEKIKKGEELSYDYGYSVDHWRDSPCRCGKKNCIGYIVDSDQWGKLKKLIAKAKAN